MSTLVLADGSRRPAPDGGTVAELIRSAAPELASETVAAKINGELADLSANVPAGAEVLPVARGSKDSLELLRHSLSHVMAGAVARLFPGTRLAIGPAIDSGFYYDFDLEHKLTPDDLAQIEAEMRRIVAEDHPFKRFELSRADAIQRAKAENQPYKVELIEGFEENKASFYSSGAFTDVCAGPHLASTGAAGGAFKLLSVAGAYWRGDERNAMLQRIYGTAFWTQAEMEHYLKLLEEARKRDHRVLGKQLDLFSVDEEIGPGLILWHPRGAMVRNVIENFWREEHLKRGYQLVYTPHIASEKIYEHSGHLENYAENMYAPMEIEGRPYRMKPMNCPGHIKIFQSQTRSYRYLPVRMCELGTVYRYERSGTLQGLLRVRGFTQDDAHIFCAPEQLTQEVVSVLELVDFMMSAFGYEYRVVLSTRPEKYLGTAEEWDRATASLREALEARRLSYEVDEGAGVFYAPKIDVQLLDALGRGWQGPTIQVDLNLPKRFKVVYIGADNAEHEVIMIHRTVLGSMERFIGGLIEHYAGAFPLWLAPEQARVLPIGEAQAEYAARVLAALRAAGLRAEVQLSNEKIGAKIRQATLDKVPYMAVVGAKEAAAGTVAARQRKGGEQSVMNIEDFVARLKKEVAERAV